MQIPILVFISLAIALLFLPFVKWFCGHDCLRGRQHNYKGERIPSSYGLFFAACFAVTSVLTKILHSYDYYISSTGFFIFVGLTVSLVGFLDDLLGTREFSGFRGHFKMLFSHGRLTTGALKGIVIGALTLLLGFVIAKYKILEGLLNALTIALTTNAVNLLDVYPGRAIKAFSLVAILILILDAQKTALLLIPTLIAVLVYAPLDFKARAMMGDVGSNFLGFILGTAMVITLPTTAKFAALLTLVAIHIYTEFHSLSQFIECVQPLRYIDRLGIKRQ